MGDFKKNMASEQSYLDLRVPKTDTQTQTHTYAHTDIYKHTHTLRIC